MTRHTFGLLEEDGSFLEVAWNAAGKVWFKEWKKRPWKRARDAEGKTLKFQVYASQWQQ